MSKLIAGTAFVLLGGATVTGGVLLFGKNGRTNANTEEKVSDPIDHELPTANFSNSIHQEGCVTKLFKGLQQFSTDTDSGGASSSAPLDANYFTTGEKKKTEGCLVVNWDKETYTTTAPNKWKGTFRFLWAVKGENEKGFVVFLLGTSSATDSNKEIKWEGGAFALALEGESESKQWKINEKHEITTNGSGTKSFKKSTESSSSEDNSKFPRPGDALGLGNDKKYWGFFTQESDLDNICGSSDCATESTKTTEKLRGYWEWKSSENSSDSDASKKLSGWTKNMDKWWPDTFGESFKVKEVAEKMIGVWSEKFRDPKAQAAS